MLHDTRAIEPTAPACCTPAPNLSLAPDVATELARAFKAIGHPVRLQILELLSRSEGQLCVCDVEACFALSQPTISHHLRILREAGLVKAEQRGLWAFYAVQRGRVAELRARMENWDSPPASSAADR